MRQNSFTFAMRFVLTVNFAVCWLFMSFSQSAYGIMLQNANVVQADGLPTKKADLVLKNGNIITMEKSSPNAQAVAVSGDRIIAVGSNEEINAFAGEATKVIDLKGKTLIPGFIESHAHFVGLGESKMMLDLTKAKSWTEIVEMVGKAAKETPQGQWIIGRGWHQEKWEKAPQPNIDGYPTHDLLSKVSPNHPVMLTHASGHMCFANGYAMRLAGINSDTQPPSGGEIVHDIAGNPIGVFRETAENMIVRARSLDSQRPDREQRWNRFQRVVELAAKECLSKGVTSFQDAGSTFSTIDSFKKLADENKLGVRLYVMVRDSNDRMEVMLPKYRMENYGNSFLTVRSIKRSIDGALGAHGAWLLLPYEDLPSSSGLNTASVESVTRTAELAITNDFQLCVHAIGDKANREVLDIFQEKFENNPTDAQRRWRVEHAQHLHPDDIPRFGELGVIASMQGIHCTSDAIYVIQRLGTRRAKEGAYVWRDLMESGAVICNGTDAPVEDIDPIACFYATVTRRLKGGTTFFPEQCMTRLEALKSYTLDAAYAAFEENEKGSIKIGKLADFAVLSQDITKCPEEAILNTEVVMTIVGGKVVFKTDGSE